MVYLRNYNKMYDWYVNDQSYDIFGEIETHKILVVWA